MLEVKNKNNTKQKGLYTSEHLPKDTVILKFKGKLISETDMYKLSSEQADLLLQIGKTTYLDLSGDLSFYIAHSCNPNAVIKTIANVAHLVSLRDIKSNEEITFDYAISSSETKDSWLMVCNCGSWNCRKTITGFNSLPNKEKEKYLNMKLVPIYINNK